LRAEVERQLAEHCDEVVRRQRPMPLERRPDGDLALVEPGDLQDRRKESTICNIPFSVANMIVSASGCDSNWLTF
jgi:hypothetical protein